MTDEQEKRIILNFSLARAARVIHSKGPAEDQTAVADSLGDRICNCRLRYAYLQSQPNNSEKMKENFALGESLLAEFEEKYEKKD